MRSAFAVFLRGFTIPFGVQSGRRIVFDGEHGAITIFDAANLERLELGDPDGIFEPGSIQFGSGDVDQAAPGVVSAFVAIAGGTRQVLRMISPAYSGAADGTATIQLRSESKDGTTSPAEIILRSGSATVRDMRIMIEESVATAQPMGSAVLVAGAVTVAHSRVTANSRIFAFSQADGGTPGFLRCSARVAGTSFTITSSNAADTSTIAWLMFEPI